MCRRCNFILVYELRFCQFLPFRNHIGLSFIRVGYLIVVLRYLQEGRKWLARGEHRGYHSNK